MNKLKILKGIVASRTKKRPFYVHFYVTRRCNLKCGMCNVWKNKDQKEMSLKEIKTAAQKLKELGTTQVVITGGEPLLRKDIFEIVSVFSRLGIITRMQTNALLLDEKKLNKLMDAGLEDISISIDTLNKKEQDRICGVKNANVSEKAINALIMMAKKKPKTISAANIVISHKNLSELVDLIKFFDSKGVWIIFNPINLSLGKTDYPFKAKADEFAFTDDDKKQAEGIYREIFKMKKQGYKILVSSKFLKQSIEYIKTGDIKWKCDAGRIYFSILPDGQFWICDEIPSKLNILDEEFMKSYKSIKFKKFCDKVQRNCEGCFYGCWREMDNLIYSPKVVLDRFMTLVRVKRKA
jgi:MoaA/NifB/PqqE/SkfB family radical SAM enzyme